MPRKPSLSRRPTTLDRTPAVNRLQPRSSAGKPSKPRGNQARFSAITLITLLTLAFAATPAQAAIIHAFLPVPSEEITKGVPAGAKAAGGEEAVTGPVGGGPYYSMTVAPGEALGEPGHLWVSGPGRVDEFNGSSGKWESQLEHAYGGGNYGLDEIYSVAVGRSTGEREVYVSTADAVAVFGPAGKLQESWTGADTPGGSFGGSTTDETYGPSLAVDFSTNAFDEREGDVYVSTTSGILDVFEPEAGGKEKYVTQLPGTCPAEGTVVGVGTCEGAKIVPFPKGANDAVVNRVAVDQANGDVLVADGSAVDIFKPTVLDQYEFMRQIKGIPGHTFEKPIGSVTVGGGEEGGDIYISERLFGGPGVVVYEFSSEGVYLGSLTKTPAGVFDSVVSEAVDPASGDVYVGDNRGEAPGSGVVDVFGPDLVVPDVLTGAASEVTTMSAVLNGTVDPLGHGAATCQFVWGTTKAFGEPPVACSAGVPEALAPVKVRSEELTGLQPDTTYYYRLQATNKEGTSTGEGTEGECEGKPAEVACFTTRGPGFVGLASASKVTATSASLEASVNPNGAATSVFFQYGRTAEYGAQAPAGLGIPLGAGFVPLPVPAVHVGGLSPLTEYHYRVVAVSEVEVTPGVVEVHDFVGADEVFVTQGPASSSLPDGRLWEMVSSPVKDGALIEPIDSDFGAGEAEVIQAAADGERFAFLTDVPTESEPRGTGTGTQVLSTRGAGGWGSRDLALPHLGASSQSLAEGNEYRFFSEDLSLAVVQPFGAFDPALSGEASEQTAFLHTNYAGGEVCADGCYRPLVTGAAGFANVPAGTRFGLGSSSGHVQPCPPQLICGPEFVGASANAQHVLLESQVPLTLPSGGDLYEWDGATGRLARVSVLPNTNSEGGGPTFATLGGTTNSDARNAISSDGSRVFFAAAGEGLYMREPFGGAGGTGVTLRLDLPRAGCPVSGCGKGAAVFQDASVDGSRVWFTDSQRLTANAGEGDLYECAITVEASGEPVCKLSDLGAAAGVLGASEDGSYLYVSSPTGVFLLRYDSEPPHEGWEAPRLVTPSADGLSFGELPRMMARVSPNGQWLAFMSAASLTGYDNVDASGYEHEAVPPYGVVYKEGKPVPARDEEVYLYNAGSGSHPPKLVCASCNPTGARPIGSEYGFAGENMPIVGGDRIWESNTWLAALVPGWTPYRAGQARYQSRYLSNSGRLFFDARDPLVPQAVNENWDVYEWEPEGVPSGQHPCSTATNGFVASSGGCVSLISSGESPDESGFLDASETGGEGPNGEQLDQGGGDVFFMSTAKLAPQDVDDSYDVYDAHECTTASPCLPAPPQQPPVCTSADQCRAAPTPEPALFAAPPSATFNGPGNIAPEALVKPVVKKKTVKCKRGFVKNRKGKCVRVKPKKKSKSAHKSNLRGK
jgi:hypothetical protein